VKRSPLDHAPEPSLPYWLMCWFLVIPVFRGLLRGRVNGIGNVPRRGGLLVVANHGSHLDPPILACSLRRPVAFMAKEELFRVPVLGAVIRSCGAYPVARGASDRRAVRAACERIAEGWATGVFLDGTRQEDGRVNHPHDGAAWLAARMGVPLLPVAIINSHRALGPGGGRLRLVPVHVRIGTPIPPPASARSADVKATTLALQSEIHRLLGEGLIKTPRIGGASPPAQISPTPSDPGH
jgi:1-acyl-sn-glycerol-3-phosphate acyltransferase